MNNKNEMLENNILKRLFDTGKKLVTLGIMLHLYDSLPKAAADDSSDEFSFDPTSWQSAAIAGGVVLTVLAGIVASTASFCIYIYLRDKRRKKISENNQETITGNDEERVPFNTENPVAPTTTQVTFSNKS